jgi:hypothetical protein
MATAAAALLILTASADPSVALHCPAPAGDALAYIAIYDGHPENEADLAPDDTKKTGGVTSNVWRLQAGPDGLYIRCGYGKKLEGPYSRMETIRLPDTVKTCRADFKPGRKVNDLMLQKFSCR